MNRNVALKIGKFAQWRHAVGFVPEVYKNIGSGNFQYLTFQYFVTRRRSQVTIVF